MDQAEAGKGWKEKLRQRLRDPFQARLILTAVLVLIGYGGIYLPLDGAITDTEQQLRADQRRLDLARQVEELRYEFAQFKTRLPEKSDANEWVQYMLGGIRQFPVKLVTLDTGTSRSVGPYRAVVLKVELEGTFRELTALLKWLESNKRLMRVDMVKLEPNRREHDQLVMQLTVLGVME